MIGELVRMTWRSLLRDRPAVALSFALPIVFYSLSVLALPRSGGPSSRLVLGFVEAGRTGASRALRVALSADPTARLVGIEARCPSLACARAAARRAVAYGRAAGALAVAPRPGREGELSLELFVRSTDAAGEALARRIVAAALSPGRGERVPGLRTVRLAPGERVVPPAAAWVLAGLLVVFLLFSATGASGWLIEEESRSTIGLVLATRARLGHLIAAQWIFLVELGVLQGALMVAWATLVFGLRWQGPAQLSRVALAVGSTAAATAGFGIALAAVARSRAQLGALSTVLILVLAALGGSFVPSEAMPVSMQVLGLVAPTSWAVSGLRAALGLGRDRQVLEAALVLWGFAALLLAAGAAAARRRSVL